MKIDILSEPTALPRALMRTGVVVVHTFGPRPWTICAPHHARSGVSTICEPPRVADNGAGIAAAALAEALGARLVVACKATGPDPNKYPARDAPYQQALFDQPGQQIIEVHGMGRRSSPYDVELAHGHNKYFDCVALGARLRRVLPQLKIGRQGVEPIRFTARSNHVLTRCQLLSIPALQVELVPALRLSPQPKPDQLPQRGRRLITAMAEALDEMAADLHERKTV